MQEIVRLRTTPEELGRLLGDAGAAESGGSVLDPLEVFKPFRDFPALRQGKQGAFFRFMPVCAVGSRGRHD